MNVEQLREAFMSLYKRTKKKARPLAFDDAEFFTDDGFTVPVVPAWEDISLPPAVTKVKDVGYKEKDVFYFGKDEYEPYNYKNTVVRMFVMPDAISFELGKNSHRLELSQGDDVALVGEYWTWLDVWINEDQSEGILVSGDNISLLEDTNGDILVTINHGSKVDTFTVRTIASERVYD